MILTSVTIKMKTIFPTYKDFRDWITTFTDTSDDFSIFILPYIYNYYLNSNICYDTPDAFKRHFQITYMSVFHRYQKEHQIIDKIYNLSDDELTLESKVVNVLANNDNSTVKDPLDNVLEFVNSQGVTKSTRNRMKAYYETIAMLSDDVIESFIDEFKKHFITILCDPEIAYCKEVKNNE